MWWHVIAALSLAGCAQIFGIEETSSTLDAQPSPRDDAQLPCLGGDASTVDPTTGACYVYFAAPVIRDAARDTCRGLGPTAHLVTIQSTAENTLVANLIGTTVSFIGAYDEVTEGMFLWDDGTPVQLAKWDTNEPSNGGGTFEEDCVVMVGSRGGAWNDVPCAPPPVNIGMYAFVCERN